MRDDFITMLNVAKRPVIIYACNENSCHLYVRLLVFSLLFLEIAIAGNDVQFL